VGLNPPGARGWAEDTLLDSATVWAEGSGEPVFDEDLGHTVFEDDHMVWQGPCSVSAAGLQARVGTDGLNLVAEAARVVRVPIDAYAIRSGHVLIVDSVHADGGDLAIVGAALTIDEVSGRTNTVLRRLRCTLRTETGPS
jgi:hypothetical protein